MKKVMFKYLMGLHEIEFFCKFVIITDRYKYEFMQNVKNKTFRLISVMPHGRRLGYLTVLFFALFLVFLVNPFKANAVDVWTTISAGGYHTLALKSDGTLWAWGNNSSGQLGLGDTTNRNTPTQVGSDTHWQSITAGDNHTLAIKQDGTLSAWGWNVLGQLGLGDTTDRNTPIQVGSHTNLQTNPS